MNRGVGTLICTMIFIFFILIVGFVIATATALARGLFAFYADGEALKNSNENVDLRRGVQQNRMMAQRVMFQGLAIFVIALLGAVAA